MKREMNIKVIALSLMGVLLSYTFLSTFIIVDFIINQDVIAKTLCVQKDDQKGCNGKCHLAKTLKVSPDQENEAPDESTVVRSSRLDFFQVQLEDFTISKTISDMSSFMDSRSYHTLSRYYEIPTPPPIFS